jgi:hypothetical protein
VLVKGIEMKTTIIILLLSYFTLSVATAQERIITESTSSSTVNSINQNETTVKSPPPSAISPGVTVINNDLCTVGIAGAVQTQILGISGGTTVRDMNCERIKLAKNLYDMGMKVAAVATLCQDERVFTAMSNAGTPCPVDGKIGVEAQKIWETNPERQPQNSKDNTSESIFEKYGPVFGFIVLLLILL